MRFHYRISWHFLRFVERILFGFKVTGSEAIPRSGAVIIASNHVSYCDPPVVGSGVPREVIFLAKEELFTNKAFAWLISRYNAIPLRRSVGDVGALRKAVGILKQGKAVLMFPEGTRSLTGRLLKPKPGIGMIASLASAPVVPAYVTGTNRLGAALLRRGRLSVSFGEPVMPAASDEAGPGSREGYQKVTEEVMRRIADLAKSKA
ncbi:MAG: lysophospholipid acyltransferase family protein [Candidatus Eisenbacteria bacterium]